MFCGFCDLQNYPGVSLDNYILQEKMVCRLCMIKSIKKLKKDRLLWYKNVKKILLTKLHGNEPLLADIIMNYITTKKDIKDNCICSHCDKFIDEKIDMSERYYYYVCGECLSFNN